LSDVAEQISVAPGLLGISFLSCAALLFASRWWKGGDRPLTLNTALIIGFFQGIAVLPGLSRSGTTIAVALALGLKREEAATFSFLLSLPAILGAAALEIDVTMLLVDGPLAAYLLGAAFAFAVGLVALYSLVVLVKKGRLWVFAPYVALAGLYALFFA
jgi:undecaprenyl-diphosphatase